MNDRHGAAFRDEAHELLGELEISLLALEESPDDAESIGRVFRAMHTIKGSGAMFGFDEIAAFTHEVETVFDLVRRGELSVTRKLIDLTLEARDQIKAMLDADDGVGSTDDGRVSGIVSALKTLLPGGSPAGTLARPSEAGNGAEDKAAAKKDGLVTFRIRFHPPRDIFRRGVNPVALLDEIRGMGEAIVIAGTDDIPPLEDLDPEACYAYWDVTLATRQSRDAVRDVFIFVEEDSDLRIDVIASEDAADAGSKKLGEILVERGDLAPADLQYVLGKQKRVGELLVDTGLVQENKVRSALVEQQVVKEQRARRQAAESLSSIRVPSIKLDALVDLVGELVTVQARLSQTVGRRNDPALLSIAEEVERLTWELRDITMGIRMLPIGTTFSKFKRLVRDLSAEMGKDIELVTEGGETELDKNIIERLNDPLVHLIRNSCDHGIETPDVRGSRGKPRQGTVRLSAVHSGASVLVVIRDDGGGLDKEAIRAKAVERGLVAPGADLSEKELSGLIFQPGFSTARTVTSVSGRGVGMDVVKQAIDALRGTIEVASVRGEGSAFTIRLPLTLAIIDGLLVEIGDGAYVLPLSAVVECVELTPDDVKVSHGRNIAKVRGRAVPYIRLRERFSILGDAPVIEQIVITEGPEGRVGLVVDRVVGGMQAVIKSLGQVYHGVRGVSGSTILGDGTVALILDVPKIIKEAEKQEKALA